MTKPFMRQLPFRLRRVSAARLAAVCLTLALSMSAAHAALRAGGTQPSIAFVTEVGNNGVPALTGSLSSTTDVSGVYSGAGVNSADSSIASEITAIPVPLITIYPTQTAATTAIGQTVQAEIGFVAQQAAAAMTTGSLKGALQTVFTYTVNVTIVPLGGNSTQGQVSDTCFLTPAGRASCLGATYGSNTSYTVYATYSQGAVAYGLPSSWTLPNPGQFQWAILKISGAGSSLTQSLIPEGGSVWHTVDYLRTGGPIGQYGLYDLLQAAPVTDASGTHEDLINCGAVSAGTCTTYQAGADVLNSTPPSGAAINFDPELPVEQLGQQVIAPLETLYGANNAVLLYGTTVQPVYDDNGDGTQTAETAVSISSRVVIPGRRYFFIAYGGAAHFNEAGTYGFLLAENIDEYQFDASGTPNYITTFAQNAISPTQNFSKSVALSRGQVISGPQIINPFYTGDQIYSYLADTVNHLPPSDYVYVAPLVIQ